MLRNNNNLNLIAIISSVLIVISCFLPWLHTLKIPGRGIDNFDGAIVLVFAVITGIVALNNHNKEEIKYKRVYSVAGILILIIAIINLFDAIEALDRIVDSSLSKYNTSSTIYGYIGSGLFIIVLGSFGLLISGFLIKKSTHVNLIEDTNLN